MVLAAKARSNIASSSAPPVSAPQAYVEEAPFVIIADEGCVTRYQAAGLSASRLRRNRRLCMGMEKAVFPMQKRRLIQSGDM